MGKIITPGENHHTETCTAATEMTIAITDKVKASRRFLVMNWLVNWASRIFGADPTRCSPLGRPLGGGVTMMGAL